MVSSSVSVRITNIALAEFVVCTKDKSEVLTEDHITKAFALLDSVNHILSRFFILCAMIGP